MTLRRTTACFALTACLLAAPATEAPPPPHRVLQPSGWVTALCFSPDGKTLASGGWDNVVRLWDVGTKKSAAVLTGHNSAVSSVAFSPGGKMLASGSWDRTVRV